MNWTFEWLYDKPNIERSIPQFQDVMFIQKIVSKDIKGVMGRLIPIINGDYCLCILGMDYQNKAMMILGFTKLVPSHKHTTSYIKTDDMKPKPKYWVKIENFQKALDNLCKNSLLPLG